MEQYNDKYILNKIINYKFTLQDVAPKDFPQLIEGKGMYCLWHENSHTGTQHARIYYDEEHNLWYMHCYVCHKNYFACDYVNTILVQEKQHYSSAKDFILSKIGKEEFIALYNMFKEQKKEAMQSQFKRKCAWIDNVYAETGNIIDYIETLYTA
jgi:hypothetical protein